MSFDPSSPPETLQALLARAADVPETGLRLLDRRLRERFLSWAKLFRRAGEVAGGLRALGLRAGEHLPIIYPTGEGFFEAFFGASLAGLVPVPLYPPVRLGRHDEYVRRTGRMVRAVGSRVILADDRVRRLLGSAVLAEGVELGCRATVDLPPSGRIAMEGASSEPALVQYTSGTTIEPKAVALTHGAVVAQVRALNALWPDTPEVRHCGVSWLPLYHDMGLIGCVFAALERPAVLTLLPPEVFVGRPAAWLQALSRYGGTVSVAPNFAYRLCVEKIRDEELDGVDLSSWRIALCGAESVSSNVLRAFSRRFARWGFRPEALAPVYGLAEATLAVTFSPLGRGFRSHRFERRRLDGGWRAEVSAGGSELVSLGPPLPRFGVEIRDDEGRALDAGWIGRVWVRGPSLMAGYLGRPLATARVIRDGWLDTGDLGFLHRGELFLIGRAKDVLIVRGRNHSPAELEEPVDAVAGARRGAAVAASHQPEGADGELLLLFVEHARNAAPEDVEALPRRCAEAVLASVGLRPDEVLVLAPGTLPRTSSGKLRRRHTVHLHLTGRLTPLRPSVGLAG